MKHLLIWGSTLLMAMPAGAQAELEIFSEMGEAFTAYLNQNPLNATPAARVMSADVAEGFYHVRIDFEDATLADFAKNNLGIEAGKRAVYIVKMNRKGEYVLRLNSYTEMTGVVSADPPAAPAAPAPAQSTNVQTSISANGGTSTTTESVSMQVAVGNAMEGLGAAAKGLGARMGEAIGNMDMNVSVTETTTSTTSMSTGGTTTVNHHISHDMNETMPATSQVPVAMSMLDFDDYLSAIKAKTFEDSKLSTAKAPLRSQHLTADQIAQVMRAFTFEDTRIEFAIFAHNRCVDPGNYYKTHGALEFELSIEEIEDAIGN